MKLVCVFSFLLLLSGLGSIASQQNAFDHFWLVLTWPPTFCQQNPCKSQPEETFTIHGLWPANKRGSTLRKPVQENANLSWLENTTLPLVGNLTKYWPSLGTRRSNEEFWKHEWLKHGSTQVEFKPDVYFQRAVSIRKKAGDIVTALKNKGVIPKNGTAYLSTQFVDALESVTGTNKVMLNCSAGALMELRICVKRDATEFISCNPKEMNHTSCKGRRGFKFPPK